MHTQYLQEIRMKKNNLIILIVVFLLTGCTTIEIPTQNQNDEAPPKIDDSSFITCYEGIRRILEDEQHLTHIEGTLQWQRGGYKGNQFTVDFEKNTMTLLDWNITYYKFYEDEYFYYRDMKQTIEDQRQANIDIWNGNIVVEIYYGDSQRLHAVRNNVWLQINPWSHDYVTRYEKVLNGFHSSLESIGCPLKGESPATLNRYKNKKVSSMAYFEGSLNKGKISDPAEVVMCKGIECSIEDHPKYIGVKDWRNYKSLPHTTQIGEQTWNNGRMVIAYNDTRYNRNLFLKDSKDVWHVYPEDTFYKWTLGQDEWNSMFLKNLFRDVLLDRWNEERSPKVYFMDTTKAPNTRFYDGSKVCTTNRATFETYSCHKPSVMFFWIPNGNELIEPRFGWDEMNSGPQHPDFNNMLETLKAYADLSDLSDDFLDEYIKIYDLNWQKRFGLREVYWEKYGF